MQYLQDRVVLITAAASGFGRLIAEKCAAGGARIVGIDLGHAQLLAVVEAIRASGGEAFHFVADITDLEQM